MPQARRRVPTPPGKEIIAEQNGNGNGEVELDCVVLVVKRGEEGKTEIIPVIQGDVRPTEVESVIKLGLKAWVTSRGLNIGEM